MTLLVSSIACWGANDEGQSTVPEDPAEWKQVDAGYAHSCGIAVNGSAFCWGWNGVTSGTIIPFGQATVPKSVSMPICFIPCIVLVSLSIHAPALRSCVMI